MPDAARAELTAVHDALRIHRVGWSSRPDYWWDYLLTDNDEQRDGSTELRGVLHETPQGPAGYALWRVKNDWNSYGPASDVRVSELVAGDPGVYAELWRFLLGIDLTHLDHRAGRGGVLSMPGVASAAWVSPNADAAACVPPTGPRRRPRPRPSTRPPGRPRVRP